MCFNVIAENIGNYNIRIFYYSVCVRFRYAAICLLYRGLMQDAGTALLYMQHRRKGYSVEVFICKSLCIRFTEIPDKLETSAQNN